MEQSAVMAAPDLEYGYTILRQAYDSAFRLLAAETRASLLDCSSEEARARLRLATIEYRDARHSLAQYLMRSSRS